MFNSRCCRTYINLILEWGVKRGNGQGQHTHEKTPHQIVKKSHCATRGTAANQRPSPLRLTSALRSTDQLVAPKCSDRLNANALRVLTTRPSGGRSYPRAPSTIPRYQRPVTSNQCASARSLVGVHAPMSRYCASRTENDAFALVMKEPLQMTKLSRPYLKSRRSSAVASVQQSQWRSPGLPDRSI